MRKPLFRAGIHLLVKFRGKYLVLKRSPHDKHDPNCWDLPGGGIQYKEKPINAALREAREEAGIVVNITRIIDMWGAMHEGSWSLESLVEADYISGEIKLSGEHNEYKWISKQQLRHLKPKSHNLKALYKVNESLTGALV